MMVILATLMTVGEGQFGEWGWRVPFLVSIVLLAISVWIRMCILTLLVATTDI